MFITTALLTIASVEMSLDIVNMPEAIKSELNSHFVKYQKKNMTKKYF